MKKRILVTILGVITAVLVISMSLTGCSSAAIAAGWAGVTVSGDNLYTVSGSGQLTALTVAGGNTLWDIAVDDTPSGGGGFGCRQAG